MCCSSHLTTLSSRTKTLQVTNTLRTKLGKKKHVVIILLGGEGGAVPPECRHWYNPSWQELQLEKDWAPCLALTTSNVHHAASLASALGKQLTDQASHYNTADHLCDICDVQFDQFSQVVPQVLQLSELSQPWTPDTLARE